MADLARECDVFTRYLGHRCTPYLIGKYQDGHGAMPTTSRSDLLDRALLAFARVGPWATGLADTYAALFRRDARLRLKLVLLVAILENAPGSHRWFDEAVESTRTTVAGVMVLTGISWALRTVVAVAVFALPHLASGLTRSSRRGG
jgi:hypothetical protein